jgi:tol-pal system protein YbgF
MGKPPKMSIVMIRLASVLALAYALWANPARAQMSESDLVTRIDHLEAEIRDLTGTVEQLRYRNQQLEQQLQRAQIGAAAPPPATAPRPIVQNSAPPAPSQYSLPPPPPASAQYSPQLGPYAPPPGPVIATAPAVPVEPVETSTASDRRGDAFDPARNPNAPGAPRPLGASTTATEPPPPVSAVSAPRQPGAPLDLNVASAPPDAPAAAPAGGELPPPPAANPSSTGAMQASLPPGNTPKDEYDLAYGYVLHKDYGLAEETFRDFLRKYPSDRLVPEAQYWLGESLFQDKQYRDAAESFLAVSTKYDTAARAADALLRLGQSLAALGEKEAACASLGEVLRKYPRASVSVKQSVDREQKHTHC